MVEKKEEKKDEIKGENLKDSQKNLDEKKLEKTIQQNQQNEKKDIQEKTSSKKMTKEEIEQALIENFIDLQKVLTNLAIKFDDLSKNISRLLELFELSARSLSEKYSKQTSSDEFDKEFLKKLDMLLDQNKTISKAIMLMEERIRNKIENKENPNFPEDNFQPGIIKAKTLPRY